MRFLVGIGAVCMMAVFAITPVQASIMETFDTDPPLAATQTSGAWYVDRYAPDRFESEAFMGDNRLALGLSSADSQANRPSSFGSAFYNTQGRKFDIEFESRMASVDFFVDDAFTDDPARNGGLWFTGVDDSDSITSFPIIEFFDGEFQGWDSDIGDWVAMGTPTGFAFDNFFNLSVMLNTTTDMITYSVNGMLETTVGAGGSKRLGNVFLQGYNDGTDRTIYFDNLKIKPIPVPAALPLLATGIVALGFVGWRRRANAA